MSKTDDQALLEAAKNGDAKAIEVLLERYEPVIYRFGMKMCQDSEDAKDVLQDTMLQMARSIDDFRGDAALSTWLYTVARSFCIKKRRKSKFAPDREESLDDEAVGASAIADEQPDPEHQAARRQMADELERAIGALKPEYREVLVLRDVEGLTAPEAADVLNLNLDAVKSRLHRARSALRKELAPVFDERMQQFEAPKPAECPDIVHMFSKHLEGEISSELCKEMEAHMSSCPRCKFQCDSLNEVLSACHSAPTPTVPDAIQEQVKRELRAVLKGQKS